MQTALPEQYRLTPKGRRAEDILRSCVHCGFCNATCPTYQLLGDELDGPRGRIYLIKDMLEAQAVNPVATTHLDRCLTCRACETTCPSGVAYGELLEIGREFSNGRERRGWLARLQRSWLRRVVPDPVRFRRWLRLGRAFAWLLPARLRRQLPSVGEVASEEGEGLAAKDSAAKDVAATVLVLEGCVQRVATPEVNVALRGLLEARNVAVVQAENEGCCGALNLHLGNEAEARRAVSHNLNVLRSQLPQVDAVISTASGCGVTLKDYGRLVDEDDEQAQTARRLARKLRDAGEYLESLDTSWNKVDGFDRVALHVPCTLQHGQKLGGEVANLLAAAGYELLPVRDSHLCCGSAGTYSMLQPELAGQLRDARLLALEAHKPDVIATANVGCALHLGAAAGVPVKHWLELLQ